MTDRQRIAVDRFEVKVNEYYKEDWDGRLILGFGNDAAYISVSTLRNP